MCIRILLNSFPEIMGKILSTENHFTVSGNYKMEKNKGIFGIFKNL